MKVQVKKFDPYNNQISLFFKYRDFDSVVKEKKILDFRIDIIGAKESFNIIYKVIMWLSVIFGGLILVYLCWSWMEVYTFNRLGIMKNSSHKIPKKFV